MSERSITMFSIKDLTVNLGPISNCAPMCPQVSSEEGKKLGSEEGFRFGINDSWSVRLRLTKLL